MITAVLLAGLLCLLIVGGVGSAGGPAPPRPSTEPPLTNGSSQLNPSGPATPAPGG